MDVVDERPMDAVDSPTMNAGIGDTVALARTTVVAVADDRMTPYVVMVVTQCELWLLVTTMVRSS